MIKPTHIRRRVARPSKAQGTTLIEVLVAALLLAIGLLSMAGIQASAVRLTKEAEFKSTAVEISSAFGEYLKANVGGVQSYNVNSGAFVMDPDAQDIPGNCDGAGAACTPAQIAAEDLARTQELARTRLPSGQIVSNVVLGAAGQSDSVDFWVMWLPPESRSGEANVDNQITSRCPPNYDTAGMDVQCQYFRIVP
ncbi:MAG TPA: type IV pilus modification protein PilV [Aquabacterium sp.]|nr:type IV pilus modification protein PilV [Aquabacterium sp.]HRH28110.1 type IV pilus modification protein PilV [Aquabacterium sp.]